MSLLRQSGVPAAALVRGSVAPAAVGSAQAVRCMSTMEVQKVEHGSGGRSSVSGVIGTVFGCTGSLGRYVVNRMGRVGSQVVCAYRGDEYEFKHLKLMGDYGQIVPFQYDPADNEAIRLSMVRSDVAVNLIGKAFESSRWNFERTHVELCGQIARTAKEQGVKRFLHVSMLGADPDSDCQVLRTKGLGEIAVREAFPEATIFRPATMYGFEDKFLNRYAQIGQVLPVVPIINNGEALIQPIHVQDVALAMVNSLSVPESAGQVYELGGPDVWSMKEIFDYIFDYIDGEPRLLSLPEPVAELYGAVLEKAPEPKFSRDSIKLGAKDILVSSGAKTIQDLGVEPVPMHTIGKQILRRYKRTAGFLEVQ